MKHIKLSSTETKYVSYDLRSSSRSLTPHRRSPLGPLQQRGAEERLGWTGAAAGCEPGLKLPSQKHMATTP